MEETLAFCYLQQAKDEKNKGVLTNRHLIIIHRGKTTRFEREQIKDITFRQRRWLLPLVAGGIVAPFSLLAIFLNLYSLWPLFLLFVLSSLAFYTGWLHHPTLTVQDTVKEHDFSLNYISSHLKAFVHFTREQLAHKSEMIYHIARAADWQAPQKNYQPASWQQDGFIHAATRHQLHQMKQNSRFAAAQDWWVLTIDPLKVRAEIRYEEAADGSATPGELFPHIYGPLNREAVVEATPLEHFSVA